VSSSGRDPYRLIAFGVVVFLLGGVALWTLYLVRGTLLVLYVAGLLAIGFSPAVRQLERRRGKRHRELPRWVAILILYVGFLAAVALALSLIIPPLVTQTLDLWKNLPQYADEAQARLVGAHLISHRYTWSELLRSLPSPAALATNIVGAVQSVVGIGAAIVTIIVLPYYLLLEANGMQADFLRLFPHATRPVVARITHNVTLKLSGWLGGQLLLSSIIGVGSGVGLALIGVPYFYVLALICAVGEVIPLVGPIFAAVPALLVALSVSVKTAIFVGCYFAIQQFLENHFIVPRVMQRQVGVSAVTVIAALLIGTELLGIVGALLAVPTAAIVQVMIHEFLHGADEAAT
jgi:predicted PurR-regulated permease PerM